MLARSLKTQWLLRFLITAAALVGLLTLAAWRYAEMAARHAVEQRMNAVAQALSTSNYPLTPKVLHSIAELTESEILLFDENDRLLSSTLANPPLPFPQLATPARPGELRLNPVDVTLDQIRYHSSAASINALDASSQTTRRQLVILFPQARSRAMVRQAIFWPLATGLTTTLALSGLATWLTRSIVRRLDRIRVKVEHISQGNYEPIGEEIPEDELSSLTGHINRMASDLRSLEDRIHKSERDRLVHDLSTGLSHDLRNTLTGARLAIQFHQKQCQSESTEAIAIAIRQLKLAEDQLGRLLKVGDHRSDETVERIGTIIDEVSELVKPTASHLGVSWQTHIDHELSHLQSGHAELLKSALLNLAFNAIQAAGVNGRAQLVCRTDETRNRLSFVVSDSGQGPDPNLGATILDPLVTTKREGVGMGLTLVANAAKRMNGSIDWQHREGQTEFQLQIPSTLP